MRPLLCFFLPALLAAAADPALMEKGRAEEKRSCVACHGLPIIHVQRLTRAQWDAELTKMTGWGAVIRDRDALLEYLAASFGPERPPVPLPRSENASKSASSAAAPAQKKK